MGQGPSYEVGRCSPNGLAERVGVGWALAHRRLQAQARALAALRKRSAAWAWGRPATATRRRVSGGAPSSAAAGEARRRGCAAGHGADAEPGADHGVGLAFGLAIVALGVCGAEPAFERAGAVALDEGVCADLLARERAVPGCLGHEGVDRVLVEGPAVHAIRQRRGAGQDRDVDVALQQGVAQRCGGGLGEGELQQGQAFGDLGKEGGEGLGRRLGREADPQRGGRRVPQAGGVGAGALGGVVRLLQQGQHGAAQLRELRQRPFPQDERAAELRLEPRDALGQRGLGDVAGFRGAGEVERLGERQEVADLGQVHCATMA